MKKWIWGAVALAAAAGIWYFFLRGSPKEGPKQQVKKVQVRRMPLRHSVTAPGEVRPKRSIELKCKASGEVKSFPKRPGDRVEATKVIAELDPIMERRNVQREAANFEAAQARLRLLILEAVRSWALAKSELDSARADYDAKTAIAKSMREVREGYSETDRKTAEANERMALEKLRQGQGALILIEKRRNDDVALALTDVARAETALADARDREKDTQIRSPIDGILLDKKVEEGQIVSSGISSASGGTTVAVVADVTEYIIVANVDDTDVGRVKEGLRAYISLLGLPGKPVEGTVSLVPPLGVNESNIIVFKVEIKVPGDKLPRPYIGMTATAEIVVDERASVLAVPSAAVKNEKGAKHVLGPNQEKIPVTTGLDNGEFVEILSGLTEGQEILIVYTVTEEDRPGRWRMR